MHNPQLATGLPRKNVSESFAASQLCVRLVGGNIYVNKVTGQSSTEKPGGNDTHNEPILSKGTTLLCVCGWARLVGDP